MASWTPLGPSVQGKGDQTGHPCLSGRVTGLAVGPGGSRVYAGASNGGVWFSSDAGVTWTPLMDQETFTPTSGLAADALSVASLAVRFDPSGPAKDTIYVLTGNAYESVGVKVSTQGGQPGTWTTEAANDMQGGQGYTIAIDPDDPSKAYAAASFGLYARDPANLPNWTPVSTGQPFGARPTGIAIAGTGAGKRYYVAFPNDQIYVSPDFQNWQPAPGGAVAGSERVVLAASESDPSVVYALDDNARLLRLVNGTFQVVTSVPKAALFPGNQGVGDIILGVDPSDPDTVYLGGDRDNSNGAEVAMFRGKLTGGPGSYTFPFNPANTNDAGADATWIGQGVHPDAHSFAFAQKASGTGHDPTNVWVGNDGGLWQSTQSGAKGTFKDRNTGLATFFISQFTQRHDMAGLVFGAGFDNGIFKLFAEQAALHISGGDGGGVAVDPNNPYSIMIGSNPNVVIASPDGGASWYQGNFPPEGDNNENFSLGPPIYTSPVGVAPTVACTGTNRVWITTTWGNSPTSWTTLPTNTNPYAGPAAEKYTQDKLDALVYSIEVVSEKLVIAATALSVYRFDLSGTTWTQTKLNMANIPANTTISGLAVEDGAAGSLYVTLGNFDGGGFDHVWYCAGSGPGNPGAGFVGALPNAQLDAPVNTAVVDPASTDTIYVGSYVGCWKGTKTGATTWTWAPFSTGLPESAIVDIRIHAKTRLLRAALDGRGIWEIPLDTDTAEPDPDIYMRINYADDGRIVGGTRYPWLDGGVPDPTRQGFTAHHWMSADIRVRRPDMPTPDPLNSPPNYLDFAVNIDDYVSSVDTETATAPASLMPGEFNQIFVEVHNRSLTPVPGSSVRVLLLITPVSAGLPPLPPGYATHIQNGDVPGDPANSGSGWLYGSKWHAADPANPYKTPPGNVDVRTPGIVEFNVDFKNIPAVALTDHVCAAAFVTTPGNPLTATQPSLDVLTMHDAHAVHRNLHLVAAGATQRRIPPEGRGWIHALQTIGLDFHNVTSSEVSSELVFDRGDYPGELSVILSKLPQQPTGQGFDLVVDDDLDDELREHLGRWLARAGRLVKRLGEAIEDVGEKLEGGTDDDDDDGARFPRRNLDYLDRGRIYRADATTAAPTISGVPIPGQGFVTALVNLRAPRDAKPGDHYRFNILQRAGGKVIGGSTYVYTVVEA